ncbi:MAG TPA: hypothetical protein VMH83_13915 [Candidatus Acidoferrum sp.]|nr:hypothetical protein [Candidatus Acidoferrum sp.]
MFPRFAVTSWLRASMAWGAIALLGGCASKLPVKEPTVAGLFENACLPEALVLKDALRKANIESKILIIHSTNFNHAAVVYVYPRDKPKVWVWDSTSKSHAVDASYDNPMQIARVWLNDQPTNTELVHAEFL